MVELKTTIAQGLHVTDDSAGYDAACKRVLSEKAILARIMKSCLEEYKDCDVNDIAEKYIEGQPQVSAVPVLPDEGGTVISGMDTEVQEYVLRSDVAKNFLAKLTDMVDFLLPQYAAEGRYALTIGIGCTGGQHRSVAVAKALTDYLAARDANVRLRNRDFPRT